MKKIMLIALTILLLPFEQKCAAIKPCETVIITTNEVFEKVIQNWLPIEHWVSGTGKFILNFFKCAHIILVLHKNKPAEPITMSEHLPTCKIYHLCEDTKCILSLKKITEATHLYFVPSGNMALFNLRKQMLTNSPSGKIVTIETLYDSFFSKKEKFRKSLEQTRFSTSSYEEAMIAVQKEK